MNFLVVDLDETLIKTDLLYEQLFHFLKQNPLNIFKILAWIFHGRLHLKLSLAEKVSPRVTHLPYRSEVLSLIQEYKSNNHSIVLSSASPKVWVDKVAEHLGVFDKVMGSDTKNLKGINKYTRLKETLGTESFTYVGDSKADLDVWLNCKSAVAVNASSGVRAKLKKHSVLTREIKDRRSLTPILAKQLRLHQWAKNALIFLPLIAAHLFDLDLFLRCILGFFAFGLSASGVYLLNDIIDVDSDRLHQTKRQRPIASGNFKIQSALLALVLLITTSLVLSTFVALKFTAVVVLYWILNLFYTFLLKKEIVLDIIILSGMYTLRIFAGSAIVNVPISHWLLSFSTLFFFNLACVKRYTELSKSKHSISIDGRGYRAIDQAPILGLGIGSGLLSILVIVLYLQSPEVKSLYSNSSCLWTITPLLLFWVGRLWILTHRSEVHDDPVVFAIKDRVSWICLSLVLLNLYWAI